MKHWKIAIARDTAVPSLGLHGLHVACNGLPNVEVVGFFDSKADDLATVMAVTGARRHYCDYVHMLDTEKPDIVILCSRHPNDHFPQIAAAAERGIHIYCEKPMTVSLQEADAIVGLVDAKKIKLCMAHPARQQTQMGLAVVGTQGTLSLRFDDNRDATLKISPRPVPPDVEAQFEEVPVAEDRIIPGAAPLDDSLRGVQTPGASLFLKSNRHALWDLMRSIEEDRQPVSNADNARLALEMIYAVYSSHLTGRVVHIPLADRTHPLVRK